MADARRDKASDDDAPSSTRLAGDLALIPLSIRMLVYSASFLALILVALPWLAIRFDAVVPGLSLDLGWFRLVGGAIFFVALAAYGWCSYVLVSRGAGAYVEFDPPSQLVQDGPFRYIRNPIAASVVAMIGGEALALSSAGLLILFLVAVLLAHLQVVLLEEPLLKRRFGPDYRQYAERVPRWFPRKS